MMPSRRTPGSAAAARANRMVVSRGKGATNTTLRMGGVVACAPPRLVTCRAGADMKAVFLAPSYPPEMQQYTRGLAEVGVDVYGVGDTPASQLPPSLKP